MVRTQSGATIQRSPGGVVRAFLLRAPSLPPQVRARLAAQVGESIAQRVQPPPPPGVPAEVFLASVAAAYRKRGT